MDYIGKSGFYSYDTSHDAACYTAGRQGRQVEGIAVHWWGDPSAGQTFDGVVSWFENSASQVSAHFVLEAGRVACMVDLDDTAWHTGEWGSNLTYIGIECHPRCSDADRETLAQLIADIWREYGRELPVVGHRDLHPTQCPGSYYAHLPEIVVRAKYYYMGGKPSGWEDDNMPQFTEEEAAWLKQLYQKHTSGTPSTWAARELTEAIEAGITTGERPQDVATREEVAIMVARATK